MRKIVSFWPTSIKFNGLTAHPTINLTTTLKRKHPFHTEIHLALDLMITFTYRYKSSNGPIVLQSSVLWLYLTEAFIKIKICICISCYLSQISLWHGYFLCILFAQSSECPDVTKKWSRINLGYSPIRISLSFMMIYLFGIELASSHLVLFRLFVGLHKINPVFLLISH